MIRLTQPIDYCGFGFTKDIVYMRSTVGTISLCDVQESSVLFTVNAIDNVTQYFTIIYIIVV